MYIYIYIYISQLYVLCFCVKALCQSSGSGTTSAKDLCQPDGSGTNLLKDLCQSNGSVTNRKRLDINSICISAEPQPVSVLFLGAWGCELQVAYAKPWQT